MMKFHHTYLTIAAILLFLPTQAYSQTSDDRLERLERDILTLQKSIYKTPKGDIRISPPDTASALFEVRVAQLEEQLRTLNGRMEETEHGIKRMEQKLDALQSLLNQKLLEAAPPVTTPSPTTPSSDAPESNATLDDTSEEAIAKAYSDAYTLLSQSKYPEAEAALTAFIKKHEKHPLTGNAYYWLGESYFAQKTYDKAAVQFLRGYQQFPKSTKAPDNLLKLGIALSHLNKTKEACTTFAKLTKEFPKAADAIKKRAETESASLKCGA